MDKLVSIIVPVYNVEKYLAECIESILKQTYTNLEIILINDGSKDNSLNICNEYSKMDSRIKVVDKENEGVSSTRNLGIEISTGEYLMFVDSDDFIDKDTIKDSVKRIEEDNYDVVLSKLALYNSEKATDTYCYYSKDLIIDKNNKNELIESMFLDNVQNKFSYIEGPCLKLIKKEFLIKNNIKFNNDLKYGEDQVFSLELYIKSEKIYFLNKAYYFYRYNSSSATHKFSREYISDYLKTINNVKEKMIENNVFKEYEKLLYYNRIKILEKIIFNYFCNKENNKKYFEKKKEFISFTNEKLIKEALENVNTMQLSFRRKIIHFLSKRKLFVLIILYYKTFMILRKIKRCIKSK